MGSLWLPKLILEIRHIFLILLSIGILCIIVEANSNCNLVNTQRYYINSNDFVLSRSDGKYIMCAAYFCSHSPGVVPLQLTVHSINYTTDNMAVHLEEKSIYFRSQCGDCTSSMKTLNNKCKSCPKIQPSKSIEIHVRLNNDGNSKSKTDMCTWDLNFNMSLKEYSCDNSKVATYLSNGNICNVKFDTPTKLMCIQPTCSKEMIIKNTSEKFIHKFMPRAGRQVCIWKFQTSPYKSLEINYSPNLKPFLRIYEDSLFNPKWQLQHCDIINNTMKITPKSSMIFVLYRNNGELSNESYLEIKMEEGPCDIPSSISNGLVKVKSSEKGEVAIFTCNSGYELIGFAEILCREEYKVMPFCSLIEKNTRVLDEAEIIKSNSSIIELDKNIIQNLNEAPAVIPPHPSSVEGSGAGDGEQNNYSDYEKIDYEDTFANGTLRSPNVANDDRIVGSNTYGNGSSSFVHPWQNNGSDLILFSMPKLEDHLIILIIVGVTALALVIIVVIALVICRKRRVSSRLSRKFDTFQNPIYEKQVMNITGNESDPSQEKIDLGNLSDSTALD